MAQCRNCKRPIKWMEVPVGNSLKWKRFEKIKVDSGFREHRCPQKDQGEIRVNDEAPEPWWNKY